MREVDDFDDYEWFEAWCEYHSRLMDEENYPGLVECCRQRLQRNPCDPHAVEALAQAYVLNGQSSDVLTLVTPYYNKAPDSVFWQWPILEALRSMGKDIEDFPWKKPPQVLSLTDDVIYECFRFLKSKRKPRTLSELYSTFLAGSYLLFSEEELLRELRMDNRFLIKNPEEEMWAEVSVHRKKK